MTQDQLRYCSISSTVPCRSGVACARYAESMMRYGRLMLYFYRLPRISHATTEHRQDAVLESDSCSCQLFVAGKRN
jgi:hypothetical protein